ncbi:MAG: hypothetical protein KF894_03230 [Labilithrix sp.]|nr:hypothetical protein [Labilithrix sp.]
MRVLMVSIAIAACVVTSCTLLTSLDGFDEPPADDAGTTPGPEVGADAAAPPETDGSAAPDAPDTAVDAGTDAAEAEIELSRDGFEGDTTCVPWSVDRGDVKATSPGRTGSQSCSMCFDAPTGKARISRRYSQLEPGAWRLEGWVRRAMGSGVCELSLGGASSDHTFGASWTRVEQIITLTTRGNVEARIEFDSTASGECMYLDDVRMVRVP